MCGRFALAAHDADELVDLLASQNLRRDRHRRRQQQQQHQSGGGDGEGAGEADDEEQQEREEQEEEQDSGPSGGREESEQEQEVEAPVPTIKWAKAVDKGFVKPRYNIAPQTKCLVLRAADSGKPGEYTLSFAKWGLIPSWTKRLPDQPLKTINCRDDTLFSGSGMWSSIRGRRRCVVIASGFYEWLNKGRIKIPHFTKMGDGKLMCMAGLWDSVVFPGGDATDPLETFTIITTSSNAQLSFLHDRMPALLPTPEAIETWLSPSSSPGGKWTQTLQDLVVPYSAKESKAGQELECYPVMGEVGKVGTESADFILPVKERKGNLESLFKKQFDQGASPQKPTLSSFDASSPKPSRTSPSPKPKATSSSSDFRPLISASPPARKERTSMRTRKRAKEEMEEIVLEPSSDVEIIEPPETGEDRRRNKRVKRVIEEEEEGEGEGKKLRGGGLNSA